MQINLQHKDKKINLILFTFDHVFDHNQTLKILFFSSVMYLIITKLIIFYLDLNNNLGCSGKRVK